MAPSANCPTCRAALQLTNHDAFDSWICPNGHGLAATLSELYERAQEDELHQLWMIAKAAPPAAQGRACPMCTRVMVSITVGTDDDEAEQGQAGDGPDTGEVPVDVCVADQVIWFDVSELELLPADLPDAQPTLQQEAALADIRRQFGEAVGDAYAAPTGFTDRLYARLRRSPAAAGAVNPTSSPADV